MKGLYLSQHTYYGPTHKWVFGWDQMLMSFFLQVHKFDLPEEENPIVWIVNDMYEIEDLVRAAEKTGFTIDSSLQAALYMEKDEGR